MVESGLGGLMLLSGTEGYRTIAAVLDPWPDDALAEAIAMVRDRGLLWNDGVAPGWASRLSALGVKPYVRQTFRVPLEAIVFKPEREDDARIVPWEKRFAAEVVAIAREQAHTLDGWFLTLPAPPTAAACESAMAAGLERLIPEASFAAVGGDRVLGHILATEDDSGRALLFDLAVRREAQWRGLPRRLVQSWERALLAAGRREMIFLTTDGNRPVHRLFDRAWIARAEESRGGYWLA